MASEHRIRFQLPDKNRSGFTLVEVLASLVVLATATAIILSLLVSSLGVSEASRNRKVATALAEEKLVELTRSPASFVWPDSQALASGKLSEILLPGNDTVPLSWAQPTAMPANDSFNKPSRNREENFYYRFDWSAYARDPGPNAGHVEVTVVVRWKHRGRDRMVSLTSALNRMSVEKAA